MGREEKPKGFTVTVSARDCPFTTYTQFKEFAQEYAGDTYWVAIQLLLERSKRLELYEGAYLPDDEEEVEPEEPEEAPIHLGG